MNGKTVVAIGAGSGIGRAVSVDAAMISEPLSPGDRVPVAGTKEKAMSASEKLSSLAMTQAAFAKDAGRLSEKFTGLARVMSGKYDWKPAQGVRSVADVFNLIVEENGLLAGVLSGTPSAGASPVPITDPEKMQEALKASYLNLQNAITEPSDNDLQVQVKLFGKDMTKHAALTLILGDQHEHLGQSIAYARTNGVAPPWSK